MRKSVNALLQIPDNPKQKARTVNRRMGMERAALFPVNMAGLKKARKTAKMLLQVRKKGMIIPKQAKIMAAIEKEKERVSLGPAGGEGGGSL